MKDSASENISAAKAAGLVVLFLAGWLAYQSLFGPVAAPVATPQMPPLPPSSLVRSGLHDYTDWVGLPEIFAVWADQADWKDGKTRFAYWHPVMKDYSYYFEATRISGGYRFREIAEPHDPGCFWDESLGADCPIRFYIYPGRGPKSKSQLLPEFSPVAAGKAEPDNVRIEIPVQKTKIVPDRPVPKP